jgi:hypothetical protein
MCLPGIWLRECIFLIFFMGSWKGPTFGKDAKALAWRCTWSHMYACWHMYNWCVLNWETVDIWIHFTQMLAKWRLHQDTPTWSTLWVHAWIFGSILHLQTTHCIGVNQFWLCPSLYGGCCDCATRLVSGCSFHSKPHFWEVLHGRYSLLCGPLFHNKLPNPTPWCLLPSPNIVGNHGFVV